MKIRHQVEMPELEETKKRFLDSPWIPVGCLVITALCVLGARRQAHTIIINVTERADG